jgi:hypothetical protein
VNNSTNGKILLHYITVLFGKDERTAHHCLMCTVYPVHYSSAGKEKVLLQMNNMYPIEIV